MKENTVSIQLPERPVINVEDEGLNVTKSCKVALKRRIESLENIDTNGVNQGKSSFRNGTRSNGNGDNNGYESVSFSKEDIRDFCNRLKAAGRSDLRVNAVKGKLEKLGEHVDWSCTLNDVTEYLNKRREEVSNRTLSDDIQAIKQFFKDMNVYWIEKIKKPNLRKSKPRIVEKEDILNFMDELKHDETENKYGNCLGS